MKPTAPCREVQVLSEWETRLLPGLRLKAADRGLVERLGRDEDRRVLIDELRDGVRIQTRSWVGVVRLSNTEIQVIPKLAGENLGLVRLIDYAAGLDALKRYVGLKSLSQGGANLLDLVSLLLVESCEQLVRGGLHADYQETEDSLGVVRGRMMADRQVLRRFGQLDRIECRFDEHTTDVPENQLLAVALSWCGRTVRSSSVAMRARRLESLFSAACTTAAVDIDQWRGRLTYSRLTEAYRHPHALAWMVLDGLGIRDVFEHGANECFAFLLDMNPLFEQFVRRWIERAIAASPLFVEPKRQYNSILWNVDRDRSASRVTPDVVLRRRGSTWRLPLDAKYKTYDEKTTQAGDIYQIFLYAYAFASAQQHPVGYLVYPASKPTPSLRRLAIRRVNGEQGAEVGILGVHIPTALDEVAGKVPDLTASVRQLLLSHCVRAEANGTAGRIDPPAPSP